MGNELNELKDETVKEGREVNVIKKQLPVTVGLEGIAYRLFIWILPIIICLCLSFYFKSYVEDKYQLIVVIVLAVIGFIPGISFYFKRVKAESYLLQLQQKLQHDASQIDNYQEQRIVILKNAAKILEKGISLDKETFEKIAALRSGNNVSDEERNVLAYQLDSISKDMNFAFENYPELRAHSEIEDVMQQNSYLQREITAAREVYNDSVLNWNREIYRWPVNKIVAAKKHYSTRIPFAISKEIKEKANDMFF